MLNRVMERIGHEAAVAHIKKYFEVQSNDRPLYTGSQFESFAGGGEANEPNRITATDLLAVSMLSVHVPGQAALGTLGALGDEIESLLVQVPVGLTLEDLSDHGFKRILDVGSPADKIWKLLRQHEATWGVGQTTASKIMARKRPHLVPIYDSVVKAQLGMRDSGGQWVSWWKAFQGEDGRRFAAELEAIRAASGQTHLSLLRVIDIVLWMDGHGAEKTRETVGDDD